MVGPGSEQGRGGFGPFATPVRSPDAAESSVSSNADGGSSGTVFAPVRLPQMPRPVLVLSLTALVVACGMSGEGQDSTEADRAPTSGDPPPYDSLLLAQDEGSTSVIPTCHFPPA